MQTTMIPEQIKQADPYLAAFERFASNGAEEPQWIGQLRKSGMARFSEIGFPTLRDEDWRFTNVAPIARLPFRPLLQPVRGDLPDPTGFNFAKIESSRLVFVNGHFAPELSRVLPLPKGAQITGMANALANDGALAQKHLGRHVRLEQNAFAALNTAFFTDGALVFIPAGVEVPQPVHLLYITTATETGATAHPRNLIVAERDSRVTILESYVSTVHGAYFTNAVTEFVIGEHATVEHCKFQDESPAAYHIAALQMSLGKNCDFISHSIATGAKLSRNNINTVLGGEHIECVLNGLYLTKDDQLADHHMIVEHAKPHCNSHEYYNGILDDRSRGVFHGRILVRPIAQKTDAKQTNKNLLLADTATANAKPQLEIYADDVKCTHGATVGQLNKDSIFYLRARGIDAETARRMLIHAFAGEIIDRIRCEPAREELDRVFWDRLEENPHVADVK
ncbi:MAG: Fe-S cluster assembly protein SufD [Verrucomicrobia subdivision 3 bacterium]|nr:Fe-S cluster assembly protein SufD [Limisphaerales bacterium]